MTYIQRFIEEDLQASLKNNKVLLVLGARQVGKTTLVKHILKKNPGNILNMDTEIDRSRLRKAASVKPDEAVASLANGGKVLIIDEAQRVKDIGRITKGWYDHDVKVKIVLLGSASANLLDKAAGALVGRNEKLWLTPFLFREVLTQQDWYGPKDSASEVYKFFPKQIEALLIERMVFGGYPEAYLLGNPAEYLTNLTSDHLFKDIFGSAAVRSVEDVKQLLIELAREAGQIISHMQLATRLKLSRQTVAKYLRLLEESFIIFSLPAYATDPSKETHKSHKYYFWDMGVRNALLSQWTVSHNRSDIDQLWQNWVLAEIKKLSVSLKRQEDLFFWQSRNGSTVDLVIKQGSDLHPFDFRFHADETKPSRAFKNMYDITPKTIHPENVLEVLL